MGYDWSLPKAFMEICGAEDFTPWFLIQADFWLQNFCFEVRTEECDVTREERMTL